MKLEIFDFIDETIAILESKKVEFRGASKDIAHFFDDYFLDFDNIVNISSRTKSSQSLKEKILRQDFYIRYKTPENLIEHIVDLIGVRIECRFIEDELDVYNKVKSFFNIESSDYEGYYYNEKNKNILINLKLKQPQMQKNGFHIYKMDGIYFYNDTHIHFELQIKSMVNVFWGEVEHKILYKNYRYILSENLFKDMMGSLMKNLIMIDKQLMILNDYLIDGDGSDKAKSREQLETLLSKIIYEIYSKKTEEEFGFIIDYRKTCDVIISYVLRGENINNGNFIKVIEKITKIENEDISFGDYMKFERPIYYDDDFSRIIGNSILKIINKDFKWNLFFKIISELETGDRSRDFTTFIIYIRDSFLHNLNKNETLKTKLNEEERNEVIEYIMILIAENFKENRKIEFLSNENIENINNSINVILKKVSSYGMWKENIGYFTNEIEMDLK